MNSWIHVLCVECWIWRSIKIHEHFCEWSVWSSEIILIVVSFSSSSFDVKIFLHNSRNFTTTHSVNTPILLNKKYSPITHLKFQDFQVSINDGASSFLYRSGCSDRSVTISWAFMRFIVFRFARKTFFLLDVIFHLFNRSATEPSCCTKSSSSFPSILTNP